MEQRNVFVCLLFPRMVDSLCLRAEPKHATLCYPRFPLKTEERNKSVGTVRPDLVENGLRQ